MRRRGYTQIRIDGELQDLQEVDALDRYKPHFIELVVDRLKPESGDDRRIRDSVGRALNLGKGSVAILDAESGALAHYSKHLVDPQSGLSLQEPQPHSFSFNSPQGYCPHCKGLGTIVDVNPDTLIPDRSKSVADGAIVPLGKVRENRRFDILRSIARKYNFSLYDPIDALPDEAVSLLLYGSDDLFRVGEGPSTEMESWGGVIENIEDTVTCPVCGGTRLNREALCFKIDGKTIPEVSAMEMTELRAWLDRIPEGFNAREQSVSRDILKELRERVQFMLDVGLDYLSLDRPTGSLSGGESQRIRLATQIGSRLVNVLYILDEPSIGLHQQDNRKLIGSLKKLRDEGNSVMVVEHDGETMRSADWLVDVGPGAGENGGRICLSAPLKTLLEGRKMDADTAAHAVIGPSLTLDYLQGRLELSVPRTRRQGNGQFLTLRGASGNNLKNVDIRFPLGCLIGVAGVSGSGKSSLVNETLMPILKRHFYRSKEKPLPYAGIEGVEHLDKLIEIDQSPIGRTPRSNPATFTAVFNDIRTLFEETQDAKVRGYKAGRFSFNVPGGRCEECKGAGTRVRESAACDRNESVVQHDLGYVRAGGKCVPTDMAHGGGKRQGTQGRTFGERHRCYLDEIVAEIDALERRALVERPGGPMVLRVANVLHPVKADAAKVLRVGKRAILDDRLAATVDRERLKCIPREHVRGNALKSAADDDVRDGIASREHTLPNVRDAIRQVDLRERPAGMEGHLPDCPDARADDKIRQRIAAAECIPSDVRDRTGNLNLAKFCAAVETTVANVEHRIVHLHDADLGAGESAVGTRGPFDCLHAN